MATIPHGDIHMAGFDTDSFDTKALITGDTPPIVTMSEVAASALAQWTVVGRDGTGKIVPAVLGTTNAIGITVNSVDPAVGAMDTVAVYRAGCFNPDVLVWGASYDTDAKKRTAFETAGAQIFLVSPIY